MKKYLPFLVATAMYFASCTTTNPNAETESETPAQDSLVESQIDTIFDGLHDTIVLISGTCNNCKTNIEKAANAIPGVKQAIWTVETKELRIGWTDSLVVDSVVVAVEAAGYKRLVKE